MARGIRQKAWSEKPPPGAQVNFGHPLANRINRVWLLNLGGSLNDYDLVRRDRVTHTRVAADTKYQTGRYGKEFQSGATGSGNGDGMNSTMTSGLGADSVSVYARFKINATNGTLESTAPGGGGTLYACRVASTDVSPTLGYYSKGFFGADTSGVFVGAETSTTLSAGIYYDLCGTFSRDASVATFGGLWKTYLNGKFDGTANNKNVAGTFGGTFSNVQSTLGNNQQWLNSAHMFMVFVYVWKRALSPSEVLSVYTNPYAFLSPPAPRKRYFITPPAAVTATQTLDESFVFAGW